MRRLNDPTLRNLAEYFRQSDYGNHATLNQIVQHRAGANGRQLIYIADQQHARAVGQRFKQSMHQKHVHHRRFVHDQKLGVEWMHL